MPEPETVDPLPGVPRKKPSRFASFNADVAAVTRREIVELVAAVALTIVFVYATFDLAGAIAAHLARADASYTRAALSAFAIGVLFGRVERAWAGILARWFPRSPLLDPDAAAARPEVVASG